MASAVIVRCPSCPDQPVLPVVARCDTRKCIRCQGGERWLPSPHPADHLCEVCRSECPRCDAPTGRNGGGGLCRTCRGLCRVCEARLPNRHGGTRVQDTPTPPGSQRYFPSSWKRDLCDTCRDTQSSDRERSVVLALPPKVVRACGGTAPAAVLHLIRSELEYRTPRQLVERIERRWWGGWSNRPLSHPGDEDTWAAYGPEDVAVWLLGPTGCPARCEDGWVPGNPDEQCPTCHPPRPRRPVPEPRSPVAEDMAATARAALHAARKPRSKGEYVPPSATVTAAQEAERVRRRAERDRTGAVKRGRGEVTAADEERDPAWAAAVRRARQERQGR